MKTSILKRLSKLEKEIFKSKSKRQQEADEKKREMCELAIKANVCHKACGICAWYVKRD